ncbi:winged helix-turn-helix transcriptional regulator [Bdellovibrionota bacterium FG-2]
MDLIRQNPAITLTEMATQIGISDRAVKKHLFNLKAKGVISRVGPDKGGHWECL